MAERPDFSDFVAARSTALLRTAYLLTGNWATAEDLLQTSLAKCWRSWHRLSEHPEPYVRATLVNTFLSWRRRRWRDEDPAAELPERALADRTGEVDERDVVWLALRRLPPGQRAVVVLRYFDDLSEVETARVLGISQGTVKSQASRALAALRVDAGLGAERQGTEVPAHVVDRAGPA
jgi:RNA polymerase sigma-70 factor (sigma-E family)